MDKIFLIIKREYLTRVKKKSFIIMTILGPVLMAAIMIVPIYMSQMSDKEKTIGIIDETGLFYNKFSDSNDLKFIYLNTDISKAKKNFFNKNIYSILYIPANTIDNPNNVKLFSDKQASIILKNNLENIIKNCIENVRIASQNIDKKTLEDIKKIKTEVNITTIKLNESGAEKKSFSGVSTAIGLFSGILIYMFIFMFGSQVMRGVIEEKTSRIVEVIVSSVKPFQLMMGKIIGIAFVGLTQFALWIILTFSIVTVVKISFPKKFSFNKNTEQTVNNNIVGQNLQINNINNNSSIQTKDTNKIFEAIYSIDYIKIILSFLFFFIGGYLLYAALFAAIGSAVDSEADTQQFMLPITIPLIFAIVMSQFVINNPDGPVSFWLSIIPLTSPIIMMIRIPFGVPNFDLALSIILLILGFIATTWLAAKIYHTGILMYGKKVNYKELWKWLKYKN
jgi:ABC-2 type transport system permease protein